MLDVGCWMLNVLPLPPSRVLRGSCPEPVEGSRLRELCSSKPNPIKPIQPRSAHHNPAFSPPHPYKISKTNPNLFLPLSILYPLSSILSVPYHVLANQQQRRFFNGLYSLFAIYLSWHIQATTHGLAPLNLLLGYARISR